MDPDPSSSILIILISLAASAFFSGMEMAFVSANRLQVELDADQGWRGRLVSNFVKRPQLFISVMLVGNNIALVVCGMESGALISRLLFNANDWLSASSPILALSVQTILTTIIAFGSLVVSNIRPVIDFGWIEADLIGMSSRFQVQGVAFDPFQATQLSTRMLAEGLPMIEVRPTVLNFSEPMKALEALGHEVE